MNANLVIFAKLNTLFLLEEYGLNEPRRHEEHEGRRKKGGKGVINYLWWALPTLL
jgi:hypothetical protein